MTLDEFLNLPFKTDGNGGIVTNRDVFYTDLNRKQRRYIITRLKKGRKVDMLETMEREEF